MPLDQKQMDAVRTLQEHKVQLMIVGGYAVNFHGVERPIDDLDIYTGNDSASANALSKALRTPIGPYPAILPAAFEAKKCQVKLIQHGFNVDVITQIDGLAFAEAYDCSVETQLAWLSTKVISKEDLIVSKTGTGRDIDER